MIVANHKPATGIAIGYAPVSAGVRPIIIFDEKELRTTPSCRLAPGNVTVSTLPVVKLKEYLTSAALDKIMVDYSIGVFVGLNA
jgi:hypothetical protein